MLRATVCMCAALASGALPAWGQVAHVVGFVTDSATGGPLAQVRVEWRLDVAAGHGRTVYTDARGRFALEAVAPGTYRALLTRVGYASAQRENIPVDSAAITLRVALTPVASPLHPVVVTASRSEQTQLDAPAAISVIQRDAIAADVRFSPIEQIRDLPGVDLASKGLIQHTFEVRGPRGPTAGAMLMLTDNRNAELPSIGLNVSYLIPVTREDIERIEVVRGPAAALYGPGATRGILHIITRSPFDSPGGATSFSLGNRSVRQVTTRYATIVHPRVAMSISADYFQGQDWPAVDSVEIRNRNTALSRGADPDTLRIGLRDPFIRRAGGEVRVDWRSGGGTEVMTKSGVADAINTIELLGQGAVQLRDWRAWYVQSKLQRGALMANVVFNTNDASGSYFVRTGERIVERSRLASVQLQHGMRRREVDFVYGMDARATDPRTGGTVHGQNEDDDFLIEAGSYAQATTVLSDRLQLIAALRADHHSVLRDLVVVPRVGVVLKPGGTHALRLTYNGAYGSPSPSDLFLDVFAGALPGGLPYSVRNQAAPVGGFTFRRDCGGVCMRSPYATGATDSYLPLDGTLLWSELVAALAKRGIDISDVPSPTRTDVATNLARFNSATRAFDPIVSADVHDVPPLRRQLTQALELGYRGAFGSGTAITAELYMTNVRNRTVGAVALTPNAFLDRATLQQYLGNFRSSTAAAQIATALAQIPVGTVSPTQSAYPTDILLVNRRGQSYTMWGADLSAQTRLGASASVFATYSWVSYDTLSATLPEVPVALTIPTQKASVTMMYGQASSTLRSSLRARTVGSFRGAGVARNQTTDGYTLLDVSLSARVPWTQAVRLTGEVQNLFDHAHREFAGGATLGRLAILRTRVEF
jgi:iron complex outermembrane receptor protein